MAAPIDRARARYQFSRDRSELGFQTIPSLWAYDHSSMRYALICHLRRAICTGKRLRHARRHVRRRTWEPESIHWTSPTSSAIRPVLTHSAYMCAAFSGHPDLLSCVLRAQMQKDRNRGHRPRDASRTRRLRATSKVTLNSSSDAQTWRIDSHGPHRRPAPLTCVTSCRIAPFCSR